MIKKHFTLALITILFLSCQKKDSKPLPSIDEINFIYLNSRRIPYNEVKINITRMANSDSALIFIESRQITTLFSILFLLTGCNNDNDDSKQSTVEFSVIAQGDPSPSQTQNISKSNLVIKDTETWNTLLSKMSTYEISQFAETNVDFTKYQIIAVFDEIYPNGGHSIDIITITENPNAIFIKVEMLKKGNDATVVTQPYQIIKIARTEKQAVFK